MTAMPSAAAAAAATMFASSSNSSSNTVRHSSPVVKLADRSLRQQAPAAVPTDLSARFSAPAPHTTPSAINKSINTNTLNITTFSPVMTPDHRQNNQRNTTSTVLLSASRTISETLQSLATTTGQQLETLWDTMGYSPEDRASQLSLMLVKLRDVCEQTIAEEQHVVATTRQEIVDKKHELQQLCHALKTTMDDPLLLAAASNNDANGSGNMQTQPALLDHLALLENTLDDVRTSAEGAQRDLEHCRDVLVEGSQALKYDLDPQYLDVTSDLTRERRRRFHDKLAQVQEELHTRSAAVVQLVQNCQQLQHDLRMDPDNADDGSTALDRRIAGSLVRAKDGSMMLASKFASDTCVGLCSVEALTQRVAELHAEKKRRKALLQDMGAEIASLWEKLHVPDETQQAFTESVVHGLGLDTLAKGRVELDRLHRLKAAMCHKLVTETRDKITELWDEMNMPEMARRSFVAFQARLADQNNDGNAPSPTSSAVNEKLLDEHEEYLTMLETRLEEMKPILRLIERREVIVEERMEYETLQKDPDRLKQRGAALTRQLMEEEKIAKRIKRDLPKLTQLLLEKLQEWKEQHSGDDFVYGGTTTYVQVMEEQEAAWHQYKADEQQRKLKKKQEEKAFGGFVAAAAVVPSTTSATVYLSKRPTGATTHVRPLAEVGNGINAVGGSGGGNYQSRAPSRPRGWSHELVKGTSSNHNTARPLMDKQTSSRF